MCKNIAGKFQQNFQIILTAPLKPQEISLFEDKLGHRSTLLESLAHEK